jgi:hypothetical protein
MSEDVKVIGDGSKRILISSIAAYEKCGLNTYGNNKYNNGILFTLKSGDTASLNFGKSFLRDRAIAWLDTQFGVAPLAFKPCDECGLKDMPTIHSTKTVPETHCRWCNPDRAFNNFEHKEAASESAS